MEINFAIHHGVKLNAMFVIVPDIGFCYRLINGADEADKHVL